MSTKEKIRNQFLSERMMLSKSRVEELSKGIAENVFSVLPKESKNLFIFLSIEEKNEVQTRYIIEKLRRLENKNIFVPKAFDKNRMEACLLTPKTELVSSKWKIPEPKECKSTNAKDLDVVFLPLLATNSQGYRIGYGEGFYDRYLVGCKNNCLKIGLGFYEPIAELDWQDEHDIALDFYVTPQKVYSYNPKT